MSVQKERIARANARNRRNVDVAMAEFKAKLAAETRGIPMKVTYFHDGYVMRKDGRLVKVFSAD